MYVFRLHLRPGGGSASMDETFSYCLSHGILGAGWRTETNKNTKDWNTYYSEAKEVHADLSVCKYISKWVTEGCLVWTRDPQANYYLARVNAGWEYFTTEESLAKDIDVANVFRVSFEQIGIDEVPGKVVASFRPPRTIQEVVDPSAALYSKFLWNSRAGSEVYDLGRDARGNPDIFSFLDSEEVEDLVFLYLQSQGWFVVPNSRKFDTLAFEYLMVKPQSGTYAQVQVKTGGVSLDRSLYKSSSLVMLFQSNANYVGEQPGNVICLSRIEVESFLMSSASWLPAKYRRKIAMKESILSRAG